MSFRSVIHLGITLIIPALLSGQEVLNLGENNYEDQKGFIYSQEVAANFTLHTNGFAFGMDIGNIETFYKTSYWHFDFGEIKNARETKQSRNFPASAIGTNFRSFIYGKQNNFFALRAGYGQKWYLSEKARRRGVAFGFTYEGGPSLGILKPYYLVLRYDQVDGGPIFRTEKFSSENEERFLNFNPNSQVDYIFGAASFTKGLNEISFLPGLHGKAALHFDWGTFDQFIKALEAGIMVDFYFQNVPIMVESDLIDDPGNTNVFINLFLTLQLGKRN